MRGFYGLGIALLLTALSATGVRAASAGYYTDQKVVYQNNGGGQDNVAHLRKLLGNLRNHVAPVGKDHVDIRVVDHGDGVVLLQAAQTDQMLPG